MKTQILVIDDDSKNIFALCAVLRSRGFECITAQSAEEGIKQLIKNAEIGMVLMDMMMPDMDGYEAIGRIKEKGLGHIPVVAVTAQAMPGDKEKCIAAGAIDYLSKPVDIDLLIHTVNRYLGNGLANN